MQRRALDLCAGGSGGERVGGRGRTGIRGRVVGCARAWSWWGEEGSGRVAGEGKAFEHRLDAVGEREEGEGRRRVKTTKSTCPTQGVDRVSRSRPSFSHFLAFSLSRCVPLWNFSGRVERQ